MRRRRLVGTSSPGMDVRWASTLWNSIRRLRASGLISQASRLDGLGSNLCASGQMLEVSLSRHTGAAHVVLNNEDRNTLVFWYDDRTNHARSREDHVVAFFANAGKSLTLEYACQDSVRNRAKSGHEPGGE